MPQQSIHIVTYSCVWTILHVFCNRKYFCGILRRTAIISVTDLSLLEFIILTSPSNQHNEQSIHDSYARRWPWQNIPVQRWPPNSWARFSISHTSIHHLSVEVSNVHHTTFLQFCQSHDFTTATLISPTPTSIGSHPAPFLPLGGAHDSLHPWYHGLHHWRRLWCPSTSANSKYSRFNENFSRHHTPQ